MVVSFGELGKIGYNAEIVPFSCCRDFIDWYCLVSQLDPSNNNYSVILNFQTLYQPQPLFSRSKALVFQPSSLFQPLTVVHAGAGGWYQLSGQPLWHYKEQLCNKQMSEENEKNTPIDILS